MAGDLRLVVVDNDFHGYDTGKALDEAIAKLSDEGIAWKYDNCVQEEFFHNRNILNCNAILVDNDFGEGARTLGDLVMCRIQETIPVAYVSAYDVNGLLEQYYRMVGEKSEDLIHPRDFEKLGIELIRKRGKNVGVEVTNESLRDSLYEFLKSASVKR